MEFALDKVKVELEPSECEVKPSADGSVLPNENVVFVVDDFVSGLIKLNITGAVLVVGFTVEVISSFESSANGFVFDVAMSVDLNASKPNLNEPESVPSGQDDF